MKAAGMVPLGGPEALQIQQIPYSSPRQRVLIRVKACGLNRSELFTRQGHSPGVQLPRVLRIEAIDPVESAPDGEFS
jgi:NADPH:quinone reductase-like Zn-dependent oxidoreductase